MNAIQSINIFCCGSGKQRGTWKTSIIFTLQNKPDTPNEGQKNEIFLVVQALLRLKISRFCSTKSFSCGDNQTSHVTGTQLGDMWHDTALLSFSSGKVFFLFLSRFFSWHLSSAKFKHVFLVLRELLKFDIYVEKGNSEYSRSSEIAPYPTPRRFSSFHQALRPSSPQSKHLE